MFQTSELLLSAVLLNNNIIVLFLYFRTSMSVTLFRLNCVPCGVSLLVHLLLCILRQIPIAKYFLRSRVANCLVRDRLVKEG